jgi:hypothetical protein
MGFRSIQQVEQYLAGLRYLHSLSRSSIVTLLVRPGSLSSLLATAASISNKSTTPDSTFTNKFSEGTSRVDRLPGRTSTIKLSFREAQIQTNVQHTPHPRRFLRKNRSFFYRMWSPRQGHERSVKVDRCVIGCLPVF